MTTALLTDSPVWTPFISIIMPTYNAARFIGQSIESVLVQTYPNWELIIMDDASTDETELVVQPYVSAHPERIRYHRLPRVGHPAGVRNAGLRLASGELLAFLDADDLYFPRTLEKLLQPLRQHPERFAVYGFAREMDEQGRPLPPAVPLLPKSAAEINSPVEPAYHLPPHYGHAWEQIVTSQISNMLPSLLLRRSAWEQIGFFNESLCGPEDYEFFVRMFLHDWAGVYCLSDYVYQYRIHSASLTKAPAHCQRLLESCLKIMDWLFTEAAIPPEARLFQSRAYVACYRYLARERLLSHQPELARALAWQSLSNPHIRVVDFAKQCLPLWLRSFLPDGLNNGLVQLRRQFKTRLNQKGRWIVSMQGAAAVQPMGGQPG